MTIFTLIPAQVGVHPGLTGENSLRSVQFSLYTCDDQVIGTFSTVCVQLSVLFI